MATTGMMRSLAISSYGKPEKYQVLHLPIPEIKEPNQVLVKIHAASIMTGDVQIASGPVKIMVKNTVFPYKIGSDFSGTVVGVGSAVNRFRIGDDVFGCLVVKGDINVSGSASEYAVAPDYVMAIKPAFISHIDAASIPSAAITALQCFKYALSHLPGENLSGKTVFVPGALSGTGSVGCQVAKNVYGATKVITTVSTKKITLVESYLGRGCVDQIIDYTTQDVHSECPAGSVDFLYNTQWQLTYLIPLVKRKTGVIVSIASFPTSAAIKKFFPSTPFWMLWTIDLLSSWYSWKLWGTGINYTFISGEILGDDLEIVAKWMTEGKLKAVVGKVAELDDIDAIREGCQEVLSGKGGLGKFVIKIA